MSGSAAGTQAITPTPKPVDVDAIERELSSLWKMAGADSPENETVTRACMSNLIIYCNTDQQAQYLPTQVGLIVQRHPARVLLLNGDAKPQRGDIEAFVTALCHSVGGGKQVCSEHVTIGGREGTAPKLAAAARSLLVGDLPTALWWAATEPPPLALQAFDDLAAMSDQVIYESVAWPDPVKGIKAVATWAGTERTDPVIADLSWRRLKPWRRILSQALDPSIAPGALGSIRQLTLEHGPHALPQAWMLTGWLASLLKWQPDGGKVAPGVDVTWRFRSASQPLEVKIRRLNEGPPSIRQMRVVTQPQTILISAGKEQLRVEEEGSTVAPHVVATPDLPLGTLVARQLADLDPDPLFRNTLQVCRIMAEALP